MEVRGVSVFLRLNGRERLSEELAQRCRSGCVHCKQTSDGVPIPDSKSDFLTKPIQLDFQHKGMGTVETEREVWSMTQSEILPRFAVHGLRLPRLQKLLRLGFVQRRAGNNHMMRCSVRVRWKQRN